jgi:hypothetical protein
LILLILTSWLATQPLHYFCPTSEAKII